MTDINEELLFNLSEDPYEKTNLIDNKLYESEIHKLKGFYHEWKHLVGDKKFNP